MDQTPRSTPSPAIFVTTRWSVVLAAQDKSSPDSAAALETLCRAYWYPLYAFVRQRGHSPHDAQDLTQEFIARLLEKDYLKTAAPEKGRFRTFLRVVLKRFLANEWDRAGAQKRGGRETHIPLDTEMGESRYQIESAVGGNDETIYDRHWALTLLEQTMVRLREEFILAGKVEAFAQMKPFLAAERGAIPYEEIAAQLGTTKGAARVAVHRLRRRFREIFREEIAQTLASPADFEDEVRHLMAALGG